jgi:lantibiotic modifying enzyme
MSARPRLQADPAVELIEVAAGIGRRLSREAIWHGERCNWVGGRLAPGPRNELIEHYAALETTLYEGTSGVALFLAELHALTGEADARRTALGAIRQALAATPESVQGRGLYSGTAGVALAAARVGRLLGEPGVSAAAAAMVGEFTRPTQADEELDLLNGTAGTIVALLGLARLLDDAGLVEAAVRLGDELVEAGVDDGAGLSWASRAIPTKRNLTGLSHGVAGMGLALTELSAATGERRFALAATRAFDYEQSTFDRGAGNWPDFRELTPGKPADAPSFAVFWCHGGPGIALSRLTALERLGDARWRTEAEAGLELARSSVERALEHGGGNFSLCHGLAGNAEILADGARVLGGGWTRSAGAAVDVGAAGVARHGVEGPWPGGAGSHEAIGLMLGIAGIGHFYLRAAGASVPSILRPDPTAVGN